MGQDLSGVWAFRAETDDGGVRAQLSFEQQQDALAATLNIDRHTLKGGGKLQTGQFAITLRDKDPQSPGNWIRLTGRLSGAEIVGTWTDDTNSGTWTAIREQP